MELSIRLLIVLGPSMLGRQRGLRSIVCARREESLGKLEVDRC